MGETRTFRPMERGVAAVTSIRCLGIESLCFHGLPLTQLSHRTRLWVQGERDKEYLIYLGMTVDGRLNFDPLLCRLSPRVKRVAKPMSHLFKNIGGPNKVICRHYTCVIRSITQYGIYNPFRLGTYPRLKPCDVVRGIRQSG